jgi:hypothetical protein
MENWRGLFMRQSGLRVAVVALVVLLLAMSPLYVLSIGPAYSMATKGLMSKQAFITIYAPIMRPRLLPPWLVQRIVLYMEWWTPTPPAPPQSFSIKPLPAAGLV